MTNHPEQIVSNESPSSSVEAVSNEANLKEAKKVAKRVDQFETVDIFNLPIAKIDPTEVIDVIDNMIAENKEPGFFITANLHYARLSAGSAILREINQKAKFLTADGMPLVWFSRWVGNPLRQRVTGADLIYNVCQRAAECEYKVFLFGGQTEVTHAAAKKLEMLYPTIKIVGIETPMLSDLSEQDEKELIARIRDSGTDLLLVALGQPKGEEWLYKHYEEMGVPACTQLGATFDFLAGKVKRAPKWVQRIGAEWIFRLFSEPRRMFPRYFFDGLYFLRQIAVGTFTGRFFGRRKKNKNARGRI
jgi:N-acetylglucosaminyldiphosphoundecaprenol N-acetyl-beta-D-mannosaminyltransferase